MRISMGLTEYLNLRTEIGELKTANVGLKAENKKLKSHRYALHVLNMELTLEQLKNKKLKRIIEDGLVG